MANRLAGWLQRMWSVPRRPHPYPIGDFTQGGWQRLETPPTYAAEQASAYSAVYACVTIIVQDVAGLTFDVQQTLPTGGTSVARNHPYQRLLRRPNSAQTGREFFEQWLASRLLHGNAYILLRRDNREVVQTMHVLDPSRVQVRLTDAGEPVYTVGQQPFAGIMQQTDFPARDILHDRLNALHHPLVGMSPISAAAFSTSIGLAILQSSSAMFRNRGMPSGWLETPQKYDEATAKAITEKFNAAYSGANSGKTGLLQNGMTFKAAQISAVDAQLIEQLRWSVEDVARVFRVPRHMLGDLGSASYRNVEQLNRLYYSGCLRSHIEAIETRLDRSLGLAADHHIVADLDGLLRAETDTRFLAYKTALDGGFLSINEVRAKEGLPPVPGGEQPRLQQQYQPLNAPAPATPESDPSDEPEDIEDEENDDPRTA